MVSTHIELTLQQLLQIALGCPQINSIHLSLLQSFFDIILKKLDCQYEKIEIEDNTNTTLQKMLRQSRISPYPFDCENITIFSKNADREKHLKERLNVVQDKLRRHFGEVRRCNAILKGHYRTENWAKYAYASESLCVIGESKQTLICKLSENRFLVMQLIAKAIIPVIHEMDDMRSKMREKRKQCNDFKRHMNEKSEIIEQMYKHCIVCEKWRQDFEKEKEIFTNTMAEINDMLLAKSKRSEGTLIKKYLEEEVKSLEKELDKLAVAVNCEKPDREQKTIGNQQCISCLGPLLCHMVSASKQPCGRCVEKKITNVPKKRYCSATDPCISEKSRKYISDKYKSRALKKNESIELDRMQVQFNGFDDEYYKGGFSGDTNPTVCK